MTDLLGAPQATQAQAETWATAKGATSEFVGLAALYWALGPERGGVRADCAYAESAKETGFGHFGGTDPVFSATPAMHNPCGLKTHDASATAVFADWATGVTAHLDHLALYAGAEGYPRTDSPDPRAFASIKGTVPNVEALGGHYAPDPKYGTSIVNDYLAPMMATKPPTESTSTSMTETWCPFATIERGPYDGGSHGGPVNAHDGVVMHVTTNWADPGPFFSKPINQASSHFWIRKDGEIVQFLPIEVASWAQSAGNYSYVSVETDGTVDVALSVAQVASFAKLYAWIEQGEGFGFKLAEVPGQPGLGWHGMGGAAWGGHTGCPGDLRKAQRSAILAIAQGAAPSPSAPPALPIPGAEHMTDGEYIRWAYLYWLGRPVDPMGYALYRTALAKDPTNGRENMCAALLASPEGQRYQAAQKYRLDQDAAAAHAAGYPGA